MKSTLEMWDVYGRALLDVNNITQQDINAAALGGRPTPYWNIGGTDYEIRINNRTLEVLKNGNVAYSPWLDASLAKFVFKKLTVDLIQAIAHELRTKCL